MGLFTKKSPEKKDNLEVEEGIPVSIPKLPAVLPLKVENSSEIPWKMILRVVAEKKSQQRTALRSKIYRELEDFLKTLSLIQTEDSRKVRNALDRFIDRMMSLSSSSD